MAPDANTTWTIIEPGLIRLEATAIHIRFGVIGSVPGYFVERDGVSHGMRGSLDSAKAHALHVVNEMMLMGFEP